MSAAFFVVPGYPEVDCSSAVGCKTSIAIGNSHKQSPVLVLGHGHLI